MRACLLLVVTISTLFAQATREDVLKSLKFRSIGPAIMGGRADDFAVVESNTDIVYAALAAGGIWKSVNGGTTWVPIFDNEVTSSVGALALAPSDPSILWAGSGEANNRQSSSWGNGVYRSMDAGKTWQHMGLKDTNHIGRIVIHPRNPNVVYVAAQGHLWGPNHERGVFKTTDGGKTWTQSLFVNDDTGVNDIAMDRESPETLYASAYQRRRTVWGMNGGGPGSGIYKTIDGGATWTKLAGGLPKTGDMGRIALDIYRRNSSIVYALVEHQTAGGVYRSDDKGGTWTHMSDTNPRPMYFSQIRIDPNNDQRIWVAGVQMSYSEDGGKTFRNNVFQLIHPDFHGFWIDPSNSDHLIAGNDGGLQSSRDRGRNWEYHNNIPIGQYYEVAYDMAKPYKLCGGLQDNYSWCGPSASLNQRGISNDEWIQIQGGDGFYAAVDPTDDTIVYTESQDGNLVRRDMKTHEGKSIRPREEDENVPRYRFQWNTPLLISAHDHNTIFYGGNYLFKSTDRGDSWKKIGNDLTNNEDRNKKPIMGKLPDREMLSRNDGVQNWPTSSTIAESTVRPGVLWVGTDDGNLQVSKDGETWKNVAGNVPGVPKGTYVNRVVASKYAEGTAFAAFDGHRGDDYTPYLFMTTNFGETWTDISKGLPRDGGTVHVVREHPRNQNLLFAGTEHGLFVSFDRGKNWTAFKANLPTVPVNDIQIHPRENDLILATHGRSLWVLDDITPLEHLTDDVLKKDLHVFEARPAIRWRMADNKGFEGQSFFIAPNPPYGSTVSYFLKSAPSSTSPRVGVTVTVTDKNGKTVRELRNPPALAGLNRVTWDLRWDPPVEPPAPPTAPGTQAGAPTDAEVSARVGETEPGGGGGRGGRGGGGRGGAGGGTGPAGAAAPAEGATQSTAEAPAGGGGGVGFGFGGGRGPMVDPGEYTVKIAVGSNTQTQKIVVQEDPRIKLTPADASKRSQAITELYDLAKQADESRRKFTAIQTAVNGLRDSWKKPGAPKIPDNVTKAMDEYAKKVEAVQPQFVAAGGGRGGGGGPGGPGPGGPYVTPPIAQRVGRLMNSLDTYSAAPAPPQVAEMAQLREGVAKAGADVKKLEDELPVLNKTVNDAGIPHLYIAPPTPAGGGRRRNQ